MSGGSTDKRETETPAATLARLRAAAHRMKQDRKVLLKNLKNARRVNQRLKEKAKKLSDSDLLQIVAMRNGVAMVTPPGPSDVQSGGGASSSKDPVKSASGAATPGKAHPDSSHDDEQAASGEESRDIDMKRLSSRMEL